MYFNFLQAGVSCSTKRCSLLHISVLQVPTGTISYQKFIDSEFPADLTLQKFLFNRNRHNIVWGLGGGLGEGWLIFFPLKQRVGSAPQGIVSQVVSKTKYRYINRAISSSIIKIIMVRMCLPVVSSKTVFIHTSQPLHFQSIDLE